MGPSDEPVRSILLYSKFTHLICTAQLLFGKQYNWLPCSKRRRDIWRHLAFDVKEIRCFVNSVEKLFTGKSMTSVYTLSFSQLNQL